MNYADKTKYPRTTARGEIQDVNKMGSRKPMKLNLGMAPKVIFIMMLDVLATVVSFFLGLWFRYDFSFAEIRPVHLEGFLSAIGSWCVITLLVFWIFRLYNSIWAFVSTPEVFRITGAYVVLGVIGVLVFHFDGNLMPRSSMVVGFLFSFVSTVAIRFSYRLLRTAQRRISHITHANGVKNVMLIGAIGTAMYNASSAILRSLGDSRTPLYALILSSVLNVVFDLLFVVVFKTGVVGAAVATVIAQIISAIYCIIHMVRHRRQLNLEGINFQTTKRAIKRIFQTGIPSALESCLISLGTMSVQRLVNSFGAMTMAGYPAAVKIDSIAIAPIVSVGSALSVFSGQNIGANQMDRIKKGMYQTLASLIGICIVIAAGIVLFRNQLLGLFLDKTQAAEAIAIGSKYLTIVCVAYIVAAVMRTYLNVLRGAGDVNTSAVAGILELIGRIIFAYILVRPLGSTGIWIATPLAWAMGASVPVIRYYSGKWINKKLV